MAVFFFFFLKAIFQSTFRFLAKLSERYRDFPYIPLPFKYSHPLLPKSHTQSVFVYLLQSINFYR